ncbi:MAG: hypothetical protein HW418_836 [Anaerolineales bacterium]|nr:hypothetical protein [Anaerolineales bacterium]
MFDQMGLVTLMSPVRPMLPVLQTYTMFESFDCAWTAGGCVPPGAIRARTTSRSRVVMVLVSPRH